MFGKLEQGRLSYVRHNQKALRAELYSGVADALATDNGRAEAIGKRIVLPASHLGSPRYMHQLYQVHDSNSFLSAIQLIEMLSLTSSCWLQDSMAIVSHNGRPDIFLTKTCNPEWPEIVRELRPGEKAIHRPDITVRVFRARLRQLLDYIYKNGIFGRTVAHIQVILASCQT